MTSSGSSNSQHGAENHVSRVRAAMQELWLRIKLHPLRNLSILALMAASVVTLGVALMHLTPEEHHASPTPGMLTEALRALDAGEMPQARNVAADLRLKTDIPAEDRGVPAYVLGAVMFHDALEEWQDRERKAYFLMAARYLEESRKAGFPKNRDGWGHYLLGKSLHGAGRLKESLTSLQTALASQPERATEIRGLLTDAYLNGKSPDLAKAAEFNRQYLEDPALSREDRDAALLRQARITFELGQHEDCKKQLDAFSKDAPGYAEVLLLQGRLLYAAANKLSDDSAKKDEAVDKLQQARELFARSYDLSARNGTVMRQSQHLQGLCLRELGDFLGAESIFARNRRSFFETSEGLASGIEEAELQHILGNDTESLAAYRRTLRQIAITPGKTSPWIDDERLRQRLMVIVNEHLQEPQFEAAVDLLQAVSQVFPDARTVEAQARLHEAWGEFLAREASGPQSKDAATIRTRARQEHRQAGVDFGRLAAMRFSTREYPSDLWRSAENFLRGQDYESAVAVYRKHLDNQARTGRPPALTRLGECLLALNRPSEALQYVEECIAMFPKDPFVYQARLIAAAADLELGREQQATELLLANLDNESLTPQSREWRDSLFALGRIHYFDGHHHETLSRKKGLHHSNPADQQAGLKELETAHAAFRQAVARLSEAIQRDPDADHAVEARYMLAQSHFYSAKLPIQQLAGVNIETTRVALRRELQRELNAAINEYDQLKAVLIARQERGDLSPVENRILRNCYFGKADALFDLEQYEDAIQAYSSATNRYQLEPESLEAFVQIAICQRKLNRPADSRRTLEQARLVLGRMPNTAQFEKTTRYNRQEWTDLLGWMSQL